MVPPLHLPGRLLAEHLELAVSVHQDLIDELATAFQNRTDTPAWMAEYKARVKLLTGLDLKEPSR